MLRSHEQCSFEQIHAALERTALPGFLPKVFGYETLMLRLAPDFFRRAIDHIFHEMERPYLAVVIRSEMIRLPEVWANLETLRTHPMANRFVFGTASTVLETLASNSG